MEEKQKAPAAAVPWNGEIMRQVRMKKLKPGRELDLMIAEKIFKRRVIGNDGDRQWMKKKDGSTEYMPHYSTKISDFWLVVEKFGDDFVRLYPHEGKWHIWINKRDADGCAETIMESGRSVCFTGCLAALKAVGAI